MPFNQPDGAALTPWIIAHRGASGDRPENTLESFERAIAQGADWLELDVVPTRDGALIVRHENELSSTTDISQRPELGDRQTTKIIEGESITGWFSEDLTLAEIQTLRAIERWPCRDQSWNGQFGIPTLSAVMERVRQASRPVGLYIELKHPAYFEHLGLPLEPRLLEILAERGESRLSPVIVESFETRCLQRIRAAVPVRIAQLIGDAQEIQADTGRPFAALTTPDALAEIAQHADGICLSKSLLLPLDQSKPQDCAKKLVESAHALGLWVHVYTFRSEAAFLHPRYGGDPDAEYAEFFELGIDGVFSDHPARAIANRQRYSASFPPKSL